MLWFRIRGPGRGGRLRGAPRARGLQTRRAAFARAYKPGHRNGPPPLRIPPLPGPGFPSVKTVVAEAPDSDGPVQDARRGWGFAVPPNHTLLEYWGLGRGPAVQDPLIA